jgi:hypothetical protein
MTRLSSHARRNAIPYLALLLVLAVGAGSGYAVAASKTKTITVCADKKTGVLHLKTRGPCKRGQTRVTWNQQGPQGVPGPQGAAGAPGPQGLQGPAGAQGPAGITVWAEVANDGSIVAGHGIAVQHGTMPGHYQVTITDARCASEFNAPVISVSDADPTGLAGESAAAWFASTGVNQQFMVFTGRLAATGGFSPSDHPFDVLDTCP